MKGRRVYIYADPGARHVLIRGARRDDLAGVPGMYSRRDRGFWVRAERLPDLLAMLETRGCSPEVIDGEPR